MRLITQNVWLILLNLGGLALALDSPTWDQQSVEVRAGEDLVISCRAAGLGNIDVVRVTHSDGRKSTTVTDNANVKSPFNKLPRYKVHYGIEGNVGTVRLHYQGIQGSDSGLLSCYKLSDERNVAEIHVKVLVPLEEVYISSISDSGEETQIGDDMKELTLQEGGTVGFGCVASVRGSTASPELEVTLGDEDKTDETVVQKNVTSISSENDLTVYRTEVKRSMIFTRVDPAHSGKSLTCNGKVKGYAQEEKSILLKVRHAPIIACAETSYFLRSGRSVTFSCNITSYPHAQIKWVTHGDQEQPADSVLTEKFLEGERIQVNLTISELDESHFATYTLTATNAIGITTENIILEEDKTLEDESRETVQGTDGNFFSTDTEQTYSVKGENGQGTEEVNDGSEKPEIGSEKPEIGSEKPDAEENQRKSEELDLSYSRVETSSASRVLPTLLLILGFAFVAAP